MQADRSCEKRMDELASRAAHTGIPQVAWFLSPAEQEQARICAQRAGVTLLDFGGMALAERRVVAFAEDFCDIDWPVTCLEITWNARYGAPGHRDLLGALLALGIGREKLGDIFVADGRAYVFALTDMARYIEGGLDRAGSVPVRVKALDEPPPLAAQDGEAVRATVSSLRLDAVLSAVWRMSRGKAAECIGAGNVRVDFRQELRPDRQIAEGMTISARGLGRAKVQEVGGLTKKGRTSVTLLRY